MKDVRPLSERFDLTYIRRPHLADRWTGVLTGVLILAALAAVVGMGVTGDKRVYTAGTLTHAHAMFGNDCAKCHESAGSGVLAGFDLPVRDEKCLACHTAPLHHPHQSRFVGAPVSAGGKSIVMSSDCSTCHIEHRGADVRLVETGDRSCVQCHEDLQTRGWTRAAASPIPASPEPGAPAAVVNSVSSFAADHPQWAVLRESKPDTAALLFGHEKHMNPGLKDGPLDCVSCHVRDTDGRYMKPITFDAHCRSCHEGDLKNINVADGFVPSIITPHASVDEVRRAIEERKALLVAQHPEKFVIKAPPSGADAAPEPAPAEPATRSRRPGAARPATVTIPDFETVEARSAWLAGIVTESLDRVSQACSYCHAVEKAETGGDGGFTIVPTAVPSRWLPRSVFDHNAHAMVRCDECHAAGKSALTSDVLLPGIDSCRQCHAPRSGHAGGAPHSCATCHIYHAPMPPGVPGRLSIQDLHPAR